MENAEFHIITYLWYTRRGNIGRRIGICTMEEAADGLPRLESPNLLLPHSLHAHSIASPIDSFKYKFTQGNYTTNMTLSLQYWSKQELATNRKATGPKGR